MLTTVDDVQLFRMRDKLCSNRLLHRIHRGTRIRRKLFSITRKKEELPGYVALNMAHIVDRLDMPSSYKDNKNRVSSLQATSWSGHSHTDQQRDIGQP